MKSKFLCTFFTITFCSFFIDTTAQNDAVETTGDVLLFALPAATFATTLIVGDKEGSWQFAKGIVLTEAVTYGLKAVVNKQRPDGSNENSFPSGHTSTCIS